MEYRALIYKVDRLGDFILASGAIRAVLEHFGPPNCLLIVSPRAAEAAKVLFPATPLLSIPESLGHGKAFMRSWRLRRLLGSITSDTGVCFRHQRWDYDELVLQWSRTPRWIRIVQPSSLEMDPSQRFFSTQKPGAINPTSIASSSQQPQLCQELQWHLGIASSACGKMLDADDVLPKLKSLPATGDIVVSPFGSQQLRDVPVSALKAALSLLEKQDGRVVLLGTGDRLLDLRRYADEIKASGFAVHIETSLSFVEYTRRVACARIVLTADTATAHIATATDQCCVAWLGGGHYGQFAPWSRSARQQWLNHKTDCFWCHWRCPFPEPHCITGVSKSTILNAVATVMALAPAGTGGDN